VCKQWERLAKEKGWTEFNEFSVRHIELDVKNDQMIEISLEKVFNPFFYF